jgi:hypothetical protein
MRKILLFALVVIVLVSLNWFRELKAQSLADLSEADKTLLKKQLEHKMPAKRQVDVYETPPIFDSTDATLIPDDSPRANAEDRDLHKPVVTSHIRRAEEMPAFESLAPFGHDLSTKRHRLLR